MSQFSPTGELNADGLYVILKLISFAAEENQSMSKYVLQCILLPYFSECKNTALYKKSIQHKPCVITHILHWSTIVSHF